MTYIVLINKNSSVVEKKVKNYDEEELYKKAGFKKGDGFVVQTEWKDITVNDKVYEKIRMYGKTSGNSGKENQYEFPPPVDTTLCFGTVVLVHTSHNNDPRDLRVNEWKTVYDHLYGGFENLADDEEDDDEEEEEEEVDPEMLTKQGYKKDGFIVDDDEEEEEDGDFEYESELSEDDYFD